MRRCEFGHGLFGSRSSAEWITALGLIVGLLFAASPGLHALDVHRDIVQKAQTYVGNGYCRGGTSPPCFDCSGFVGYVLKPHVSGLPRVSREMARYGATVNRNELRPGDLVFFATTPNRRVVSHVALYIGQDSIVHAISDGPNRGVNVTSLNARYWRTHFHSAGRVLPLAQAAEEGGTAAGAGEERTRTDEPIRYAKGLYTGELKGGEPHGNGELKLDNGDFYEGEFAGGVFEGDGLYEWSNGAVYRGEFADGRIHGQGTYVAADGTTRSGIWEDGSLVEAEESSAAAASDEPGTEAVPEQSDKPAAEPEKTYLEKEDSPWEDWDGYITGDYYEWRKKEQQSFEEWKRKNQPQ